MIPVLDTASAAGTRSLRWPHSPGRGGRDPDPQLRRVSEIAGP
jgi:hypothetical protein